MSDDVHAIDVASAVRALAEAADGTPLALTGPLTARLALAALQSFDLVIEVQDGVSAGVWANDKSRAAVRRRLRDHAAVQALDNGFSLTADAYEDVVAIDDMGQELDPDDAEVVVVTHHYPARRLLPPLPGRSRPESRDSRASHAIPEQEPSDSLAGRPRLRPVR